MRKIIITAAISALIASPAFARGGHGGGGHCSHGGHGHGSHSHGGGHHGGSHASAHAAGFSISMGHDGATGSQSTGSHSCNLRAWLASECRGM